MAKWGEGDPRWIVEDRPDGTNVNNWHWSEKNASPWSKDRLKELLEAVELDDGSISGRIKKLTKCEGEATANNRKAKLIFFYEWELEMKWESRLAGSDIKYEGTVEVPNLSDENEVDDLDISIYVTTKGEHAQQIKDVWRTKGTPIIRAALGRYMTDLRTQFSSGLILATSKPQTFGKSEKTAVNKQSFQNMVISDDKDKKETKETASPVKLSKSDLTTVDVTQSFKVPPSQLFEVFIEPNLIKSWTNMPCEVDPKEGGSFTLFNGMVTGTFTKITSPTHLVLKWRLRTYPPGHHAKVDMKLEDEQDATELKIHCSSVPKSHVDETEMAFTRQYVQNISRTFGFGARIL